MSNFAHVKSSARQVPTAEIPIEGLKDMRPLLICRPANEDNPAYFNALLRRQRRSRRAGNREVTVQDIKRNRADDIELLPKHCVTGWVPNSVLDSDGNAVAFSEEECRGLLEAILAVVGGREIFDDFRQDVANSGSFEVLDAPGDAEALAGN